jgi:glycosyltransferase involved in cell wall biosynthesis
MRIGLFSPHPHDATSYWRGWGPYTELEHTFPEIKLGTSPQLTWADCYKYDIAVMQRPAGEQAVALMDKFKKCGIPVVADFDDLLFDVPKRNKAHGIYMNRPMQDTLIKIMKMADAVTTTTQYLADFIKQFNPNVYLIPNAHNYRKYPGLGKVPPNNKQVVWRGTDSHKEDLGTVVKQILEIAHERPDIKWTFVGDEPAFIDMFPKGVANFAGGFDIPEYFEWLQKLQAQLLVVPLDNRPFNLAKSNISWVEATYAGMATLAPASPEWHGAATYTSPEHFKSEIIRLIDDHPACVKLVEDSKQKIPRLSIENKERYKLLKSLVEK